MLCLFVFPNPNPFLHSNVFETEHTAVVTSLQPLVEEHFHHSHVSAMD